MVPNAAPSPRYTWCTMHKLDESSYSVTLSFVTAAERAALADIRQHAAAGRIHYSGHALDRARQRGASARHIRCALTNAAMCAAADDGKWKATGPDLDGDDLTCVVALEGSVVVVTVF